VSIKKSNKKLKRSVLLLVLEICAALLKGDFKEQSFQKISVLWVRILHDNLGLLSRIFPIVFPPELGRKSLLHLNPRVFRVGRLYRTSRSKFKSDRYVPRIRMTGLWLEENGFCIGTDFAVYSSHGRLILQPVDFSSLPLGGDCNG